MSTSEYNTTTMNPPVVDEENPAVGSEVNSPSNSNLSSGNNNNNTGNKQDHTNKTDTLSIANTDSIDEAMNHLQHDESSNQHGGGGLFKTSVPKRRNRTIWIVTSILLFIVALGLGLGLGLSSSSKQATEPASTTSESPTSPSATDTPSQQQDEEENELEPPATQHGDTLAPEEASSATEVPSNDNDTATTGTPTKDDDFAPDAYEWPILVGVDGQQAADLLEQHYPGFYDIYVIPEDSVVSMDYDVYRIRIFVNTDTNLVVKAPMIG